MQREGPITFIMVTHSQQEALSMADKVIVMSDALVQQIGSARDIYEYPRTKFVAQFIGNNNLFSGKITSKSGSIVFVEANDRLFYVKAPTDGPVSIGADVHFSVRADMMSTGEQVDMANRIEGAYITTEYMGSLETDVFEVAPGHLVNVEQHRKQDARDYAMGDKETLCWPADAAVLLTQ